MIDDRTEAREILGLMIGDEPPVTTTSAALVGKARRRQVAVRTATFGGVAMGVVGMLFFTALARPGPQPSENIGVAAPPTTPTSADIRGHSCRNDDPECSRGYVEDDRSRRLTSALRDSLTRLVPEGMTARGRPAGWEGTRDKPWMIVKPTVPGWDQNWPYEGGAQIGDDKSGFGSVYISVSDKGTEGRCASLDRTKEESVVSKEKLKIVEYVDCRDETLGDGTLAAVSTYRGRNAGGYTREDGYRKTVVDAVRPDGTRLHVVADNSAPEEAITGAGVSRAEPPLTTEYLFKIVQLPALKW